MAVYNKRIEFNRTKLLEHYSKRDSLLQLLYGVVRFLGIIVQNIYCVSSYLVLSWIVLLPISWIRADLYSKAENYLYNSLLFIVSSWSLAAGATVVEAGDEFKYLIENSEYDEVVHGSENGFIRIESNNCVDQSECDIEPEAIKDKVDATTADKITETNSVSTANQSGDPISTVDELDNDLSENHKDNQAIFSYPKISYNNNRDTDFVQRSKHSDTNDSKDASDSSIGQIMRNERRRLPLSPNNSQKKPRILFLCNHISTADVPLIMQSFSTMTNQSLLWVLDAQFKPTNFGLVCSSHGDFFIAKDFTDGSLRDQVLKYPDRNLLVLFPEGGFWRKRLEGSNRYASKNNLPMTKYVIHPRFGAFKDLIDPSVDVTHIVDATLLYDDIKNPLSILDIALGHRKQPAILNYKVYNRGEINPTEEWLRNIWLEKDKLLQQYYEDRNSVYKRLEGTMRSAKLDWLKVFCVHLFYLLVSYLTIYRLFSATSLTMLKARDLYYSNI